MDGCKADFVGEILRFLERYHPEHSLQRDRLTHWDIFSFITDRVAKEEAIKHMQSRDFFYELEPIPAAIDAFNFLVAQGHDVRICTTPISREFPAARLHSMIAKRRWVKEHLSSYAEKKMIFADDKSVISADVIIDDNPFLTHNKSFVKISRWLIVDHPYNQNLPAQILLPSGRINNDWSNFYQLCEEYKLA